MLGIPECRACQVLGQPRSTKRYQPNPPDDEVPLTAANIQFARQYGRYGYRRMTTLLRADGRRVNHKRVERIRRREGLKVPQKQPPRRRLWLTDGACVRMRPQHPNHVWAYDFVATRTEDGRPVKLLTIVDEVHSRVSGD
jgi:putative transposase